MNKQEIAGILRAEVGEQEVLIKKLQARCGRMKVFMLDLEAEHAAPAVHNQKSVPDNKFRKAIEKVFGEEPKGPKR